MPARNDLLRTPAVHGERRVDRNENTIFGCKMIQLGAINDDRPLIVDEGTLSELIDLGNANPKGLKARFTHPNMSSDGMGKFLGRWTNFRREGDSVLADLHLSTSAFVSPHGDMGSYVLELAEDDPEAFGVSAAGRLSQETLKAWGDRESDEEDPVPIRWRKMMACDVVDEPAATRGGLFDVQTSDELDLHSTATLLLDQHLDGMAPREILERFRSFLQRWCEDRGVESNDLAEKETMTKETTSPPTPAENDHKRYVDAFGDRGARLFLEGKSFEECLLEENKELKAYVGALEVQLGEKMKEFEELRATLGTQAVSSPEEQQLAGKSEKKLSPVRMAGSK